MKKFVFVFTALFVGTAGLYFVPVKSQGQANKFRPSNRPIPNRYIVVLNDELPGAEGRDVADRAREINSGYAGSIDRTYAHALKAYSAEMSADEAERLSADPRVNYVEEDGIVETTDLQTGATWGLDRIDQRSLPLNSSYSHNASGLGVHAYIIDTGIRASHMDFGGRATADFDAIGDGRNGSDCNGHGTHVAGTVGGAKYGVAKNVTLHAVRVLNCTGSGSISGVIAGIDWVTANAVRPAVVNMSLGGNASDAMDAAVENSIASGITYAVAAGNNDWDACALSPARAPSAITVGATDQYDIRAYFSNYGSCLDVFAPGVDVISAWFTGDTTAASLSGTSMASPHTAGVAAQYLEQNPFATPGQVQDYIVSQASRRLVADPGRNSPNLLLYSSFGSGGGGNPGCLGATYTGSVSAPGQFDYQSSASGFQGRTGTYSGAVDTPDGAQFKLTLERKQQKVWSAVAASSGTGVTQTVVYNGKSGTYRWRIESITGGGGYSLCSVNP